MSQRHRIPTIFSIYMLDVICCALGCVVLLWQVAHQEAEKQTAQATQAYADAEMQSASALRAASEARQQSSIARLAAADAIEQSLAAQVARAKFQESHQAFLSASTEAADLQALLALLQERHKNTAVALARTEKERADAAKLAQTRQDEMDKTRKALLLSQDELKILQEALAKLQSSSQKTGTDLAAQKKTNAELETKIAEAEKKLATLKNDIASRQTTIDLTTKQMQEQTVLLKISAENALKLKKELETLRTDNKTAADKLKLTTLQLEVREQDLERARADLKASLAAKDSLGKELTLGARELLEAKKQINALTTERDQWKSKQLASSKEWISEREAWKDKLLASSKELSNTTLALGALKDEKNKLSQRVVDLQAEADQRFAGVPLTGENVVFLIDISGSMLKKDLNTPDPDKWPFLCETLMKLMKSIPTMRRFQVILFSDKVDYLHGFPDEWIKYDGPNTAVITRDKLKKYAVGGNTNMHDGFEVAFRYRKKGLDTIYLFSDGLPNVGPGLPPNLRTPSEAELSFHLGKYVRNKLTEDWNRPIVGREPVRINAIGFFFESPDVGAFLWAMVREHRGNFAGVR